MPTPMWSDPRFLIPPAVAAAIDRGRAHLRQNPLKRVVLEQLLDGALRGSVKDVDKLLALGSPPVTAELYEKHQERENAARAAWSEDRKRQTAAPDNQKKSTGTESISKSAT